MRISERIANLSIPEPNSGCWLWLGAGQRYGRMTINGKSLCAHRISWIETYGPIPKGMYVLHRCDQSFCVNSQHLFLGTQKDNINDMYRKNRRIGGHPVGERAHKSKLTEIEARYIIASCKTNKELAKQFLVTSSYINNLRVGKTWKHLT